MRKNGKIRVAILDLYEGQPNQGMRCLRDLLRKYAETHRLDLSWDEFEVRLENRVPDLSYDIYLSSGGPGSPLESENSTWENRYFGWLKQVEKYNAVCQVPHERKHIFFICHSFQLACRHYDIAQVTRRRSTAFGVFPVHMVGEGKEDELFKGLQDPFYAVDSRNYQVVSPEPGRLNELGACVLAIEKDRPHVPLERAVMALRFNDCMVGTQFHPEADAEGMSMYLLREDRKKIVIAEHGEEKWQSMITQLDDPDKIRWTSAHVIPNFLDQALRG